jgi:hypothetical protein
MTERPMKKAEYEKKSRHGNVERKKYLGLACKECDDPKHQICPSCDWRYEKLIRIDRLMDGMENWDDFAENDEKRRLRRK